MQEILLNKELPRLSDGIVLNYKDYDLNFDISKFLDKELEHDNFIWFLRRTGTELVREKFLNVSNSSDREIYEYYKDNGFLKAFKIKITNRKRKYVYGTVEELKLNEVYKTYNTPETHTYSLVKILDDKGNVVKDFNDNKLHKVDANKSYKNILFDLELDDNHKIYTIDYISK